MSKIENLVKEGVKTRRLNQSWVKISDQDLSRECATLRLWKIAGEISTHQFICKGQLQDKRHDDFKEEKKKLDECQKLYKECLEYLYNLG